MVMRHELLVAVGLLPLGVRPPPTERRLVSLPRRPHRRGARPLRARLRAVLEPPVARAAQKEPPRAQRAPAAQQQVHEDADPANWTRARPRATRRARRASRRRRAPARRLEVLLEPSPSSGSTDPYASPPPTARNRRSPRASQDRQPALSEDRFHRPAPPCPAASPSGASPPTPRQAPRASARRAGPDGLGGWRRAPAVPRAIAWSPWLHRRARGRRSAARPGSPRPAVERRPSRGRRQSGADPAAERRGPRA